MDFDKQFNYRKSDCCENCLHTTRRRCTGVAWCIFRGTPELEEVCDLYTPLYRTARILEKHCHRSFVRWEYRWLKNKGIDIKEL